MKPIKIGYYSLQNCFDRRAWSGIIFSMCESLVKQGVEFVNFGDHCRPPRTRVAEKVRSKFFSNKKSRIDLELQKYAIESYRKIKNIECDIIFAPVASSELHYLFQQGDIRQPVIYASDVTFRELYRLYKPQLTLEQVESQEMYEASALSGASKVVFPTSWAANSAAEDYSLPTSKLSVIPYGANIAHPPALELLIPKLSSTCCRLLFIGVDWERKGGDVVIDAFNFLEKKGLDVELYILGTNPKLNFHSDKIHVIPFLNKNLRKHRERFEGILLNSHFLVFPTKADTFGIVNCEANAYGIPVIASNAGGVSSVVRDGVNGHVLPLSASGEDYAAVILKYFSSLGLHRKPYESLMLSARHEYETRLNWDQWGKGMHKIFQESLS